MNIKEMRDSISQKIKESGLSSLTGSETLIWKTVRVEKLDDGFKAIIKDGSTISVFFDGTFEKFSGGKKCKRHPHYNGGYRTVTLTKAVGPYCSTGRTDITAERAVMILSSIYEDSIEDLKNQVNIKDLSGCESTRERFGLGDEPNLTPDNLEWCSRKENLEHKNTVRAIKTLTDLSIRISAKDIGSLKKIKEVENLRNYIVANGLLA